MAMARAARSGFPAPGLTAVRGARMVRRIQTGARMTETGVTGRFEIFLAAPPGLEPVLAEEVREAGFAEVATVPGGVTCQGGWAEVWRANFELRGAGRVLARFAEFRAFHLAQLDKRARKVDWGAVLRPDVPVRVEASCRKSKIYHAGAAAQRIEGAIAGFGAPLGDGGVTVRARIEDNLVTLSVDTSGELLHKRGHKVAVAKAPMRETLAALFLRACAYRGAEPVLDPMCGSGTFVIESAEIAMGLKPGRSREFAFERLATFDAAAWAAMKEGGTRETDLRFLGFDRDAGAVRMATENAARAGVADVTAFAMRPVAELTRPEGPPGLVIVNPPYGGRIGNKKALYGLYASLGARLMAGFAGWRVGLITTEAGLAKATGLPFLDPSAPIAHGGLKVKLWQTGALE